MPKLNQIIAVEKAEKNKAKEVITQVYHAVQRVEPLSGISRTYQPKDEEGERLPSEESKVQVRAEDQLRKAFVALTSLFDVVATKDQGNTEARADVKVGDRIILKDAPVTYLLFLEKQLVDIHTLVKKLPVLAASETWEYDPQTSTFRTPVTQTVRTKKVPKAFVKAPATDKHPAQVEVFHEDILVGTWSTTKFSGAMPQDQVNTLLERVETLQKAVKMAREDANNKEVIPAKVGKLVFDYILEG